MFKSGEKIAQHFCLIKLNVRNIRIRHKFDPDPVKMGPDPPHRFYGRVGYLSELKGRREEIAIGRRKD